MAEEVKPQPRRRYDTTRRQAQAAQTRQDIVAAAQRVFLERGYSGATLTAIAQAAGVVVETIYRGFGSKASLFKVVVRAAVAGGAARAAVPPEQRPAIQAVIAETDPRRQFQLYAATQPGIHARAGPLLRVLVGAAAADPELAEVWAQLENERLAGMGRFAQRLADRGVLRPGLSAEDARDVLWPLNSMAARALPRLACPHVGRGAAARPAIGRAGRLAGVSGDHGCLMPSGWPTLMRFCWWHAGLVLDRAAVLVYDLNLWRACTRRRSAARRTGTCARWPVSAAGRRWSRSGMWAPRPRSRRCWMPASGRSCLTAPGTWRLGMWPLPGGCWKISVSRASSTRRPGAARPGCR